MSRSINIVSEINEMVLEIVGDHMGIPAPTLSPNNSIAEELGADSLDKMELIMTVEELFGIKIPNNQISSIKYIRDIISAIESASLSYSHIEKVKKSWKMVSRASR